MKLGNFNIKPLVIYLTETQEWIEERAKAEKYFAEQGITNIHWMRGVHSKWGVTGNHIYLLDNRPEEQFFIGSGKVCQYLSFIMLYNIMDVLEDDIFLMVETDCVLLDGWMEKLEQALKDVPDDWDFLFAGSCCAADKEPVHVKGNVFHFPWRGEEKKFHYPQCGHFLLVRKKAIPYILQTQCDVASPIDTSLIAHTFPKLNIYSIMPRIATQGTKTELPL